MKCYTGPLTGNAKCVVISLILASGYWFLPPRNKWVLAFILYSTYLAIAWYDAYLCERALLPTYLRHFYEWAKPAELPQSKMYKNLCPEDARKIVIVDTVVLLVLLILLPSFLRWTPRK